MFLSEPQRTNYDLSFDLFRFPVRIHPGFFILPVILGYPIIRIASVPGAALLIVAAVFFISILVHELGHALAFKYFGIPSRIVLYWFGGLAIPETGWGNQRRLQPNQQIIVSLAGPAAGFALAALVVGIVFALQGSVEFEMEGIFPMLVPDFRETPIGGNEMLFILFYIALFCNIVWNVLNLAPVLPLDGGQVCRELCLQSDYAGGLRTALIISAVAAGVIAVLGLARGDTFAGVLFALLGISSYMTLQQMSGRGGGYW